MDGEEEACPRSFLDPVSLEIMRDPVLTADGQTFDRETIETWLANHDTSPLHGQVLASKALVPNFALRHAIDEWRAKFHKILPRDALEIAEEIGRGSFKVVHKATLKLPGARAASTVAVLRVNRGDVAAEAGILLKLGCHPRLVKYLGQCNDGEDTLLAMEYAPLGALSNLIEDIEDTITVAHRETMLQQICAGMEALAEAKLIHRDLALRNVLVFGYSDHDISKTSVKVSDFGLTVNAYTAAHKYVTDGPKPIRYLAPEALKKGRYSEKSDVWAFGVTAWELLTDGTIPYFEIPNDAEVIAHVTSGKVLPPPENTELLPIWESTRGCLAMKAADRPNFAELGIFLAQAHPAPSPSPRPSPSPLPSTSQSVAPASPTEPSPICVTTGAAPTQSPQEPDPHKPPSANSNPSTAMAASVTDAAKATPPKPGRPDVSQWKYADLRDAINTSHDVDLLEACRLEFHRRLKVYHAWKNIEKRKAEAAAAAAPKELHENPYLLVDGCSQGTNQVRKMPRKKKSSRPQRYYRVPTTPRENRANPGAKEGLWYAHFDGQWIARQMEVHEGKQPVLLRAGKDDMEMLELSLDETGLARKRGIEILPREFESEWRRHGGTPYP